MSSNAQSLNKGDLVKVIGTTVCGLETQKECIKIGTICKVVDTEVGDDGLLIVGLVPITTPNDYEYWYLAKDVEKGHLDIKWVKD